MQVELTKLKDRILEEVKASKVGAQVEDISIESDRDDEGTDFLRVIVQVKDSDKAVDADFESFLEAVERAVGALDERYPSVRFADAA